MRKYLFRVSDKKNLVNFSGRIEEEVRDEIDYLIDKIGVHKDRSEFLREALDRYLKELSKKPKELVITEQVRLNELQIEKLNEKFNNALEAIAEFKFEHETIINEKLPQVERQIQGIQNELTEFRSSISQVNNTLKKAVQQEKIGKKK